HADAGELGLTFRQAFLDAGFKLSSCLIWRKNRLIISRADYHWQHEPILYGWKPTAAHRWFGDRKKTTIQELLNEEMISKVDDDTYQLQLGDVSYLLTGDNILVTEAESSVVRVEVPTKNDLHPTMKPVALIERLLLNSSKSGELVLDPFGGSGSTLIACEKIGRQARQVELDEKFCDVIVKRWQDFTGKEAFLAEEGSSYNTLVQYGRGYDRAQ
ncbi:MAG: site-specific DNA-methyltransferase, partial [Pseudomonadota bacterium]|nr:site-specific DNA-methyltransferase [Pseudomonadota bacterium]